MSQDAMRDASTDRLLQTELTASTAPLDPAGPACLDAERLAAWADGQIWGVTATDIEAHLADCARCRALAAAFARTDDATIAPEPVVVPIAAPAAARAPAPFRPRRTIRWFLPVAAGAVAATALIWTNVRRDTTTAVAERALARADAPVSAPVPPAAMPTTPSAPPPTASSAAQAKAAPEAGAGAPAAGAIVKPAAESTARPIAGGAVTSPLPIGVLAQLPLPAGGAGAGGAGGAALPPAPAARTSPAADAVRTETAARLATQPVESVEITFSSPPIPASRGGAGGVRAIAQAAAQQVRWLVSASGKVLRSASGGATWDAVSLDPGAAITGGVAPSANVCWLVGKAGVVLRSQDGFTFARIRFPEAVDLRSITAADDREATITTADGRTFKTDDGGVTWRRGGGW